MKHNIPHQSRKGTITPNQITVSEYSGLMPHPDNLAKFEEIQPGFASPAFVYYKCMVRFEKYELRTN